MAKDQDARIAAFEKQVHEETQKKISAQQAELEKKIAEELEAQKEELEKQLAHMDRIYEESHSAIARQLLAKIVNHKLLIPNFPEGRATADSLNVAIATAITFS